MLGLALTAVYIAAGKFGLSLALVDASASPVWPPSGIAVAALLLLGRRYWPAIAVGAFVVNITTAGTWWTSLAIAGGNTLEACLGAWLVARFAGGADGMTRPTGIAAFAALAGGAATLVAPTVGVGSLWAAGSTPAAVAPVAWLTWWIGDAIGVLVLTPLIVLWHRGVRPAWTRARRLELAALATALAAVASSVFCGPDWGSWRELRHLCVMPLLWACLRFGLREALLANLIVAAFAIGGTLLRWGDEPGADANTALLLLQAFIGTVTLMALTLAAVVDQRRRLELELADRAENLARSNRELEQFAFVASHDLREPLRMISSYADLIDRRQREALNDTAKEHLAIIRASARRMGGMIDGLLAYARVGRQRTSGPVRLDDVLDDVVADLGQALQAAEATVTRDPQATVLGSRAELTQLLQNLVGNALKFRGDRPARVHIGGQAADGMWVCSVRDEGAGIDPAFAARVFTMFARGDGTADQPGAGIGLAVCKRVVEAHGGRIWFESAPNAGTTFRFTLPLAPRQQA